MPSHHTPKRIAIAIELHWNLPWHLDCFQGIVDYGRDHGWECLTDPYLSGTTGDGDLSIYDGVVGRITRGMIERIQMAGLSAVTLLFGVDLHSVRSDSEGCARLAGEHLLACGYRRLGYVCDSSSSPTVNQSIYEAFQQRVEALGGMPPLHAAFNADDLSHPERSQAIRRELSEWVLGQEKPIGLYINDMATARYLTQICQQLGIRVPEDVGMVVHNTDRLTATRITPTLTEVVIDHWEQGYQAAAVLDQLMRGERVEPRTRYITGPRIITRESSDRFLCEDELVSKAMRYVAEHARQAVSAEDVAAAAGVSRRTLDRRFEEVLGKTVSHEITRLRVLQLENTLAESELTMAKIAELFEFGSASQFTQYFKKHAGITPTAYRERYRRDDSSAAQVDRKSTRT